MKRRFPRARPWRRVAVLVAASALALSSGAAPAATAAERATELWKEGAGLHLEGDYEGAIALYRDALALRASARIHTYLAWSLSELERYAEAVDHCRRAIDLDAGYPNAYNDLGSYLIDLGRPQEAIPWLRKVLEMSDYCCPHFAYYHLGRAQLLRGQVDEASEALRTALQLRPGFPPAYELLRRIRGLQGL